MDQWLFRKVNGSWTNPFFDAILPYTRESTYWLPLYLFALVFVLINFGIKGLWWCVFFVSTVALTDMTGTYLFKHIFLRVRPCRDPDFASQVRLLLDNCSGGSSFISNHAANHFGMAVFFIVTFRHILKKWVWLALFWAVLIAYSQVYVGVHYPGDVLCGALVGVFFGSFTGSLFNKRFGFTIFDNQPGT